MHSDLPETDGREQAARERDANRCQSCQDTEYTGKVLGAHQVVPGVDHLSNYLLLCQECHEAAHTRDGQAVTA